MSRDGADSSDGGSKPKPKPNPNPKPKPDALADIVRRMGRTHSKGLHARAVQKIQKAEEVSRAAMHDRDSVSLLGAPAVSLCLLSKDGGIVRDVIQPAMSCLQRMECDATLSALGAVIGERSANRLRKSTGVGKLLAEGTDDEGSEGEDAVLPLANAIDYIYGDGSDGSREILSADFADALRDSLSGDAHALADALWCEEELRGKEGAERAMSACRAAFAASRVVMSGAARSCLLYVPFSGRNARPVPEYSDAEEERRLLPKETGPLSPLHTLIDSMRNSGFTRMVVVSVDRDPADGLRRRYYANPNKVTVSVHRAVPGADRRGAAASPDFKAEEDPEDWRRGARHTGACDTHFSVPIPPEMWCDATILKVMATVVRPVIRDFNPNMVVLVPGMRDKLRYATYELMVHAVKHGDARVFVVPEYAPDSEYGRLSVAAVIQGLSCDQSSSAVDSKIVTVEADRRIHGLVAEHHSEWRCLYDDLPDEVSLDFHARDTRAEDAMDFDAASPQDEPVVLSDCDSVYSDD